MADLDLQCPLPLAYEQIVMAHGGGGRLMQQLLDDLIRPVFKNDILEQKTDSAVVELGGVKLAFTTDSYVIKPVFFPGGDIGKLAVCGTLNDLAMSGAKPIYLSCSMIIEEGFPTAELKKILQSMQDVARQAGVQIVTGDTKVVDRGKGDGIYLNTAGIGVVTVPTEISPARIQPGDRIIVNGDLARHGMAVMLEREGMNFEHAILSDCADLSGVVQALIAAGIDIHSMRDLTRGGLAGGLVELAVASSCHIDIDETALPFRDDVLSACEILGLDPLYIANEGCFAMFVPDSFAETALTVLRQHPLGKFAACIGKVESKVTRGKLTLTTVLGSRRVLDLLSGEQLPRIC